MTRQVLQSILRDFAPMIQKRPGFHISLNVAASDLADPSFLPMLESALRDFNVRPQNLVVEITERSAANSESAKETIRDLRRLGHRIHIDDFGAGYSNLDRLLYLYADTIKIDKAFTRTIGTESVAGLILPQIMNMAQSLNLEVIVEGIETTQQADYFSLATKKIYGQGWLFGRPMPAEALSAELLGNSFIRHPMPAGYTVFGIKTAGV
ncbi:MAG: EAL domain-containing protein [Terracidiphilus sp.]